MRVIPLPTKRAQFLVYRQPGVWMLCRGWWALAREQWQAVFVWSEDIKVERFKREEHIEPWVKALLAEARGLGAPIPHQTESEIVERIREFMK